MRELTPRLQDDRKQQPRVNTRIRVPEVRLLGAEGEQLGVVPTYEALKKAQDLGLDLVEISPTARPPVCRCMDFGKYLYLEKKKQKQQQRASATVEEKEVKLKYKTGEHDIATYVRRATEWLAEGCVVKISLQMRGRENAHPDVARAKVQGMVDSLSGVGKPLGEIFFEGRAFVIKIAKK